jgi:hypothetical protein
MDVFYCLVLLYALPSNGCLPIISFRGNMFIEPSSSNGLYITILFTKMFLSQWDAYHLRDLTGGWWDVWSQRWETPRMMTVILKYCHVMEWLQTGFRIGNCIYRPLTYPWLQVIITVSLIHTLYSWTCCVFISRCLVTASSRGCSPFSGFPNCSRASVTATLINSKWKSKLLYDLRFTANHFVLEPSSLRLMTRDFFFSWTLLITPRHELHTKHHSIIVVALLRSLGSNYDCIPLLSWKYACLQRRCLTTAVVYLLIPRSLPSNGSKCHMIYNCKHILRGEEKGICFYCGGTTNFD